MQLKSATPRISVRLYKTISRETVDGQAAVSARYAGKDPYIDLTPFLGEGASVVTTKSVRDPAGAFSITFADRPQKSVLSVAEAPLSGALESIYGLVEPMDVVEIRMWSGLGAAPLELPIKMRGFVSDVQRMQTMNDDGRPVRQVVVRGQDYGKIWQIFRILYLQAYAAGNALLTTYNMWELFGIEATNTLKASEFIRLMVEKIINPFIDNFMPKTLPMPRKLLTDDITVKHGKVNNNYQSQEGTLYDLMKLYGDVGVWNELYTEDREDGVHVVYRAIPAMHISKPKDAKDRKIQDDAPDPVFVPVPDTFVQSLSCERSDQNVANFFWVNNSRFDLIDELYRKLFALKDSDTTVNLKDYPNSSPGYYGVRPMYAETMQFDDAIANGTSGLDKGGQETRSKQMEDWIVRRRRHMVEMNKDNVVLERGSARLKGGLMRADGREHLKAGDYALFQMGAIAFPAYVVQITDEFVPFVGYTASITFERGEGFVTRVQKGGGFDSPWLAEQASRAFQ